MLSQKEIDEKLSELEKNVKSERKKEKRKEKRRRGLRKAPLFWLLPLALLLIVGIVCLRRTEDGSEREKTQTGVLVEASEGAFVLTEDGVSVFVLSEEEASLQVHFLDVGEADCILLLCDGETMLVDAGNTEDADYILAYLDALGITRLDVVIFTHPHEDHIGGGSEILSHYEIGTVYLREDTADTAAYRRLLAALSAKDCSVVVPVAGEEISFSDCTVTVLGPITTSEELNANSLVIRVEYGEICFLFTGDATREEEEEILESGADVSCTVLKVAHHGSSTSSSYRFLRETWASVAVISVEADNAYGHPHESVLSRLSDADMTIYRTDELGTIVAVTDGTTLRWIWEESDDGSV